MKAGRDKRLFAIVLTVVGIGILGGIITLMPGQQPQPVEVVSMSAPIISDGHSNPPQHAKDARSAEIDMRFKQAAAMLHAMQYDYAAKALHRVLELSPRLVEAHVNMGYALLGQHEYKAAYDFFVSATELRPKQVNAYYGMAEALEGMGELEGAMGAMRTFIHLANKNDPFITKARAAVWEWEGQLTTRADAAEIEESTSPSVSSDGGREQ